MGPFFETQCSGVCDILTNVLELALCRIIGTVVGGNIRVMKDVVEKISGEAAEDNFRESG